MEKGLSRDNFKITFVNELRYSISHCMNVQFCETLLTKLFQKKIEICRNENFTHDVQKYGITLMSGEGKEFLRICLDLISDGGLEYYNTIIRSAKILNNLGLFKITRTEGQIVQVRECLGVYAANINAEDKKKIGNIFIINSKTLVNFDKEVFSKFIEVLPKVLPTLKLEIVIFIKPITLNELTIKENIKMGKTLPLGISIGNVNINKEDYFKLNTNSEIEIEIPEFFDGAIVNSGIIIAHAKIQILEKKLNIQIQNLTETFKKN